MIARKMISISLTTNFVRKFEETEIVVRTGYFNSHVGSNPENYEDQHGSICYGVRKKGGEMIPEFCEATNMTVGNTLSKKRASHLATYESGPSKTQINNCLVRRQQNEAFEKYKSYLVKSLSPSISHWYVL